MKSIIKNINPKEIVSLKNTIAIREGEVVSRTLIQNDHISMTLFSFDEKEEIATHASGGDALVYILEGSCEITIDENKYSLKAEDSIVMPASLPHSLFAKEAFKMLLVVVFDETEEK